MNLNIGKVYTFNTLSPAFLGATLQRLRLKSIADLDTARTVAPIDQLHAQIYPTLPEGSPKDPASYTYYIFEAVNKSTVVLADAWIDTNTVELIQSVDISVRLVRASLEDVEKVRVALNAAGLKDFTITTS